MRDLKSRRLIARWFSGAIIGTGLIAVTSPLFVRSYQATPVDQVRRVQTLVPGSTYRWRSEGYANTEIGPLGMPGKNFAADLNPAAKRIALWGDSQAEGVCVADHEKLFAQLEQLSHGRLEVFPLARSGDDVASWLAQMPPVESKLGIDQHVFLIADLPDLLAIDRRIAELDPLVVGPLPPAFLIQAVRNIVTEADGSTARRLRFSIGPVKSLPTAVSKRAAKRDQSDWPVVIQRLQGVTDKPIWILYAPPSPQIIGGQTSLDDPAAGAFTRLQHAAEGSSVRVLNLHPQLCQLAQSGRWPHGFHNGQIGVGHLNRSGYAVIAETLLQAIGLE